MNNYPKGEITPFLCRLGREAAGWSQQQLAEAVRVTKKTIASFETGRTNPQRRTLEDIQTALEAQGVEFIPAGAYQGEGGPGVRLRAAPSAES